MEPVGGGGRGCSLFGPNITHTSIRRLSQFHKGYICFWLRVEKMSKYVGDRPKEKESIAVMRASARRRADFGKSNELHLY